MKCYIIDDEQHAIDILSNYITKVPGLRLAGATTDPMNGIIQLKADPSVDVVFLDIDMPIISGIEAIELLPEKMPIIFTTAFSNYAVDAFEFNAVDFLLKPISFSKFLKGVEKLERFINSRMKDMVHNDQSSMFINPGVRGKVIQVHFSEILYIEGLKNYVIIYTDKGGKYITYLTMNEMVAALPETKFIRIHKSYIVSVNKIQSVEGNTIHLPAHIQLPLGYTYKEEFMALIDNITVKTGRKQ